MPAVAVLEFQSRIERISQDNMDIFGGILNIFRVLIVKEQGDALRIPS